MMSSQPRATLPNSACGMVNVELGGDQRFGLKWAVLPWLVLIAGAVLSCAVSLER